MSIRDRDYYMGQSTEGHWIFAEVRISRADPERIVTFTDHSTGPAPATLGITFIVIDGRRQKPRRAAEVHDKWWLSAGQVPPEDRVIERPMSKTRLIEQAWLDWHLNDMQAACDHMTEEMLNPSDEVLDEYIRVKTEERGSLQKYSPAFYGRQDALQKWRLENVTCPESGYRWGHAWLVKTIDQSIIDQLMPIAGPA